MCSTDPDLHNVFRLHEIVLIHHGFFAALGSIEYHVCFYIHYPTPILLVLVPLQFLVVHHSLIRSNASAMPNKP